VGPVRKDLTPAQEAEAPETAAAVVEGGEQQGVEEQSLHQEPEEVGHSTVVTEHHSGLTVELDSQGGGEGDRETGRERERERERESESERQTDRKEKGLVQDSIGISDSRGWGFKTKRPQGINEVLPATS